MFALPDDFKLQRVGSGDFAYIDTGEFRVLPPEISYIDTVIEIFSLTGLGFGFIDSVTESSGVTFLVYTVSLSDSLSESFYFGPYTASDTISESFVINLGFGFSDSLTESSGVTSLIYTVPLSDSLSESFKFGPYTASDTISESMTVTAGAPYFFSNTYFSLTYFWQ